MTVSPRWSWLLASLFLAASACGTGGPVSRDAMLPDTVDVPETAMQIAPPVPSPTPQERSAPTAKLGPEVSEGRLPINHYPSLNQASALAFDGQGGLWAGTRVGVVRWDLATGEPALHRFEEGGWPDDRGAPAAAITHDLAVITEGNGQPVVWAATSGGVRRYASGVWTRYTVANGLPDDVVYAIAVAPDGTVWAGTDAGLARADGRSDVWVTVSTPETGLGTPVWAVDVAPAGTVWASTHGLGVLRHDPVSGRSDLFGIESGFAYPNARALAVDGDGMPWVQMGYDHVYRFDGVAWQVAYEPGAGQWVCDLAFGQAPSATAMPVIASCDGDRAYGTGVVYAHNESWSALTQENGLPSDDVRAVALGPGGEIAAATSLGLAVGDDDTWRLLRWGPMLPDVRAILPLDDEIWFGFGDNAFYAAGGGLTSFNGLTWSYEDPLGVDGGGNVRALATDAAGELWAGAGCNLTRRTAQGWEVVVSCQELSGNVVDIEPAADGSIVFATETAVYRLAGGQLERHAGRVVLDIAVDPEGGLWLAQSSLSGGGLVRFDGTTWLTETLPVQIVTSLAVTFDGVVFALGDGRVLARDETGTWSQVSTPHPDLRLLKLSRAGGLWALAASRVLRLEGESWETVFDAGGMQIHTFAVDGEGTLWLGTSVGALSVELES